VRTALAVGAVLLLGGCGGNVDERPAATGPPIVATEPPPPITAIDEPAPELVEWSLNAMFSEPITDDDKNENTKAADITVDCATSTSIGGSTEDESEETTADCPPPLTAEQSEELRQMQKTWRAALSPAPGTHPLKHRGTPAHDRRPRGFCHLEKQRGRALHRNGNRD
jgi:hypothetical protein